MFGSLSPMRRFDRGPALIAQILRRANGSKSAELADHMPWPKKQSAEEIEPADLDTAMQSMFAALADPPKE